MHEAVRRAQAARQDAQHTVSAAKWRTMQSHLRAAVAERGAALVALRRGAAERADAHLRAAARYEAKAAAVRDRIAAGGAASAARPDDPATPVHVHLGFADAESREAVLMLLHDLGGWSAGRLIDAPGQGARFEMTGRDLHLCETAVRERLRLALHDLTACEDVVTVFATRPAGG